MPGNSCSVLFGFQKLSITYIGTQEESKIQDTDKRSLKCEVNGEITTQSPMFLTTNRRNTPISVPEGSPNGLTKQKQTKTKQKLVTC